MDITFFLAYLYESMLVVQKNVDQKYFDSKILQPFLFKYFDKEEVGKKGLKNKADVNNLKNKVKTASLIEKSS